MDIDPICAAYAPIVTFAVQFLKRVPLLQRYPKLAALFLAFALSYLHSSPSPPHAFPLSQIVACALVVLAGSIAAYEVFLKPAMSKVNL